MSEEASDRNNRLTLDDWFRGTQVRIDALTDYVNTLPGHFNLMADNYYMLRDYADHKKNKSIESQALREFNYIAFLLRIFLNSFHVAVYAFLEDEIRLLASIIGEKQHEALDISDMKGRGYLNSACLNIEKLTKIDCKTFHSWNQISEAQRLRNIIVHSNGRLTRNNDIKVASKHKVLDEPLFLLPSATHVKEVGITIPYSITFLKAIRDFFSQLCEALKTGGFL